MDGLELDGLVLKLPIVLAVFVGDGADLFGGFRGQFAVRGRVSERDLLAGVDADLALEQNQILIQAVLGGQQSLLLRLKLDASPQDIEISHRPGLVFGAGLIGQHLIGRFLRLGVAHLALSGDGVKIGRGHLLDHLFAGRHLGVVSGFLRCARGLPSGDDRTGKQRLIEVNLALGEVIAGDIGKPRGHHATGKHGRKQLDDAGAKTHRDKVLLVDAGFARERDGGQKLLQSLVLFSPERRFVVFGFLQSQVVLKAAAHGVVQRELQRLIAGRTDRHAAEKRIVLRGGVGGLGVQRCARARKSHAHKKGRHEGPSKDWMKSSIH